MSNLLHAALSGRVTQHYRHGRTAFEGTFISEFAYMTILAESWGAWRVKLLGALPILILMLALEVGTVIPSMLTVSGDGNAGPVFIDYALPDGDLWTSAGFPVEVWVSDADDVSSAYLQVAENDTWLELYLGCRHRANATTGLYDLLFPLAVPSPGLVVNYTFRFKANDALGNMAITDNITTSIHRGEGPVFVSFEDTPSYVVVSDPDGIDTVRLHICDPVSGLWSTRTMTYTEMSWPKPAGDEYVSNFSLSVPLTQEGVVYRFRLEANDTLGNTVLSSTMTRVYKLIITDGRTTADAGLPATLEALAVLVAAGCIAVIVILRLRHRP